MNFDTTEKILLVIMFLFGIAAIYVTKKSSQAPKSKISMKTINVAENWTVFSMDKDGNCVNSAYIPKSEDSFIIGTSPEADLRILNNLVSRKHLIVITSGNKIVVSDNNSSYSTFSNGVRIIDSSIKNKQVIWLADSPVIFVAPGTYTDEQMLKALIKQNIEEYGVPEIIKEE